MNGSFYRSRVLENLKLNDKFNFLSLEVLDQPFSFTVGQFVILKISEAVYRDYSIFSLPQKMPIWEMLVDISPQGPGTKYIAGLKREDIIETGKPCGIFSLKDDGGENLLMGATGCGLASIKPMLEQIFNQKSQAKIHLFWGLREEKDLFYQDVLNSFQQENPGFHYEIVLSQPENNWLGKRGHINEHLTDLVQSLDFPKTSIYLCGSGAMIEEIKDQLKKINFLCDRIYFEKTF